jgi:hypothetical protein
VIPRTYLDWITIVDLRPFSQTRRKHDPGKSRFVGRSAMPDVRVAKHDVAGLRVDSGRAHLRMPVLGACDLSVSHTFAMTAGPNFQTAIGFVYIAQGNIHNEIVVTGGIDVSRLMTASGQIRVAGQNLKIPIITRIDGGCVDNTFQDDISL